MTAKKWKKIIKTNMEKVGTYKPAFDKTIETLAAILEHRDEIYEVFTNEGAEYIIEKISDRGARNVGKNPLFVMWTELNAQALSYWRDLGLTPAGLKRIDESAVKISGNKDTFESLLSSLNI